MTGRRVAVSLALAAVLFATARTAHAASQLDDATAQAFGGTYAVDCRRPGGVRLFVAADTLAIEAGPKHVESHDVQRALTFGGGPRPADYKGTLLGDIPRGEPIVFQAYRDAKGVYLVVDADVGLQATFGKAAFNARFRACEAVPKPGSVSPAAPPAKRPAPPRAPPSK